MQFMSSWMTNDKKTLLHFSHSVLDVFCQYIQMHHTDREAGGLLLGSIHGGHLWIEQATVPTMRDKRSRHLFERMPFGHDAIALARWTASQGTVRYLGEWHTHLQDQPHPSALDRSEWSRLSEKRRDKRPMLAVIVGRKTLHVELVPKSGRSSVFLPVE